MSELLGFKISFIDKMGPSLKRKELMMNIFKFTNWVNTVVSISLATMMFSTSFLTIILAIKILTNTLN